MHKFLLPVLLALATTASLPASDTAEKAREMTTNLEKI